MKAHHSTLRTSIASEKRPKNLPTPYLSRKARGVSAALSLLCCLTVQGLTQTTAPGADQRTSAPTTSNPQTGAESQGPPAPEASPAAPRNAPPTVPSPNSSTQNGLAGAVDNTRYVIGADDNLQITVWREPSLSGVLPVRPDGMISLVLIGDLRAAGRTPTELSNDIKQQLKKYIQDPSVTVAVTAVNSQRIFLVGEVGHVGPIPMSPGMTPLQAISAAGGPSPYANLKRIYKLRGLGAKQQKITFNYKQALKGDNRQDITLQPGDTIVVP